MFNVLPDILKDEIRKNYTLRLYVLGGFIFIFVQISFLIFLLPTIINSTYKEKELANDLDALHSVALASKATAPSDNIPRTNNMLHILDTTLVYPHVVPIVDSILAEKNTGVRISNFGYVLSDSTHATVSIQGNAETRDSFVAFVRALQDSEVFESVDSPVSNLAKEKNIDFTITVSVVQKP